MTPNTAGTPVDAGLVPLPRSVVHERGTFAITPQTAVAADAASARTARQLTDALEPACGFRLAAVAAAGGAGGAAITLAEDPALAALAPEGYRLEVRPEQVLIRAPTQAGLFYGVQTLRQLLPPAIFSPRAVRDADWRIPCVTIEDGPRFGWRGLMLDTGHDYQRFDFILRFIDLMALHKFNVFHWHITDLGTFPLEIRGYPKLQDPAALGKRVRGDPPRGVKPGRYTHDQVRAVVRYAAERHITVVPEVDMPGHSAPVLTVYPELDCPVPHKTWEWDRWEYCIGNEETFRFLQEVLSQVIELFPSRFIHIGGDECPKEHWQKCPLCQERMRAEGLKDENELQSYFVRRLEAFLNGRGRRLIGWDEILEGGLAPNAAVMSWRPKANGAVLAARAGHDVVVASCSHLYFDYPESQTPLETVYGFEPVPAELSAAEARHILGAQAQLWSDNHPTEPEIERLVYPRACAVAEAVWTPADSRAYADFQRRLAVHAGRMALLGIS